MEFVKLKNKYYRNTSLTPEQQNLVSMYNKLAVDLDEATLEVNKCKLSIAKIEDLLCEGVAAHQIEDVPEEDVKRELEKSNDK